MSAMDNPPTPEELEKLLAERFRNERKRLNMSAVSAAHYCGVATSTVFNWEAGKARIPLAALAILWRRGFDVEGLVQTPMRQIPLPVHHSDGKTLEVSERLLRRYCAHPESSFVLQCPSPVGSEIPAGQLCLMQWCASDPEVLAEIDGLVLIQLRHKRNSEVMCHLRPAGKGRIRISLNELNLTIGAKAFLAKCEVVGEYLCRVGFEPFTSPAQERNMRHFAMLIEEINDTRLVPGSKRRQ